jgi:hypothetical protein
MSHFLQFAPAENAKVKKVAKVLIAAKRFKQMGTRRAERRRLEEVTAIKDELTLKNPETEHSYDRHTAWTSDKDGVQNFTENTKGGQPIQDIPFMTEGLAYVLNNNEINTVAQLLAKFLELNDGSNEPVDICNRFEEWLNEITKGTIAEKGTVEINEGYVNPPKIQAKVAVTKIIAHYADDRGLIETNWPEGNVYNFFK